MVISELCSKAENILINVPDRSFDRWCIIEDIGGLRKEYCYAHPTEEVSESVCGRVTEAAEKRAAGYPLQYILGRWEFYGMEFKVGEGVLIPRPDTECLVDAVLSRRDRLIRSGRIRIMDLCSGSGCIAAALAKELGDAGEVMALENSSDAFPYLVENIKSNGVPVKLLKGDVMNGHLLDNFRSNDDETETELLDCIVSNPPYLTDKEMEELQTEVRYEPDIALHGGSDGLKFYRVISCLWKEVLRAGGLLAFEIGTEQETAVRDMLINSGFEDIFTENDATGSVRVIGGYLGKEK